ncbi:3-keto-steroid reductase [Dirofilaria immitis]
MVATTLIPKLLILILIILGSSTIEDSVSDTRCTPNIMMPFCWWAIDLVTATQYHLYRNGMSSLLEHNIYLICNTTVSGTYGLSFMNVTTNIPYINLRKEVREAQIEERQKILVEVIYYCCKSCEHYENKTNEEIIEDLATEFYKRRLINSDDTAATTFEKDSDYCINANSEKEQKTTGVSCIFMLDVNTPAKVHVGAMHWNTIDFMMQSSERENTSLVALALQGHFCLKYSIAQIPEGKCIRYASIREYFVLCCCYERPELCAYTISNKSMSNVKVNHEIWLSNLEIRNSLLANELNTDIYDMPISSWTYRDFIYSKPTMFGYQKALSTSHNIPLWHCAVGRFIVYSTKNISTSKELESLERELLPHRTQYCIADFWIEFKQGQTESIIFEAKEDAKNRCNSIESIFCQLVGPECLNDLLHISHIQAQYRCCCNRGNLCNHWGNNNPAKSKYQIALRPQDLQNVIFQCHIGAIAYLTQIFMKSIKNDLSEICWRSFDFHFEQEILMIDGVSYQQDITYRVAFQKFPAQKLVCEILHVFPLRPQNCHREDYIHQSITYQFFKCKCKQQIEYFNFFVDLLFNYQIKQKQIKTCDENMTNYFEQYKDILVRPSCYEMYNKSRPLLMDLYSFSRNINFTDILATTVVTNSTPICVTFVKITRDRISFGMHSLRPAKTVAEVENSRRFIMFVRDRAITFVQRCQTNLTKPCNERINCETNLGCFDFHSFGGVRQRGCIDQIPRLIGERSELTALNYCNHAKIWRSRSYICSAIRNITHPHANTLNGVLCCCKRICPLSNQVRSPTNNDMGFNIFDSVI